VLANKVRRPNYVALNSLDFSVTSSSQPNHKNLWMRRTLNMSIICILFFFIISTKRSLRPGPAELTYLGKRRQNKDKEKTHVQVRQVDVRSSAHHSNFSKSQTLILRQSTRQINREINQSQFTSIQFTFLQDDQLTDSHVILTAHSHR
jgi:hypothetical protein